MDIEKWKTKAPKALAPSIQMSSPNQDLEIYSGRFELKHGTRTFEVNGRIWYKWYPEPGINFSGSIIDVDFLILTEALKNCELFIDGLNVGAGFIKRTTMSKPAEISGILSGESIFGDPSIPVNTLDFSLLNLRSFYGSATHTDDEDGVFFF